jgi:hypothetical protein
VRSFEGASSLRKADGAPYRFVYSFDPVRCQHFRRFESPLSALTRGLWYRCYATGFHLLDVYGGDATPHIGHIPPSFLTFLREVADRGVSRQRRTIGDDLALPDMGEE